MAYKYSELEKQALDAIEKHKLFFIADVVAYLPCSYVTFYDFKLNESNAIKDALTKVKTDIKVSMRSKWYKSENATLQMGLMKLISTDEELRKLSMQTIESKNDNINNNIEMTPERAKEVKKIFDADY